MKENIIGIVIFLFFSSMFIRDFKRMREVIVKAIVEPYEIVIMILLILFIITLNIIYPKGWIYIAASISGIMYIFVDFFKQGLTNDDILIVARGKEAFSLKEISKTEIIKNKRLCVKFYQGHKLIYCQKYKIEDEECVLNILKNIEEKQN